LLGLPGTSEATGAAGAELVVMAGACEGVIVVVEMGACWVADGPLRLSASSGGADAWGPVWLGAAAAEDRAAAAVVPLDVCCLLLVERVLSLDVEARSGCCLLAGLLWADGGLLRAGLYAAPAGIEEVLRLIAGLRCGKDCVAAGAADLRRELSSLLLTPDAVRGALTAGLDAVGAEGPMEMRPEEVLVALPCFCCGMIAAAPFCGPLLAVLVKDGRSGCLGEQSTLTFGEAAGFLTVVAAGVETLLLIDSGASFERQASPGAACVPGDASEVGGCSASGADGAPSRNWKTSRNSWNPCCSMKSTWSPKHLCSVQEP
jgi:hypothetical protein